MTRSTAVVKKSGEFGLPVARETDLQPRSDLTFRVLDGLSVDGRDAHQSLLNGCLVRNCTFRRVRFSRCDLEQIQFQGCTFEDVNFENVELNSAVIDKCKFDGCKFDDALISDTRWAFCSFKKCSFQKAVIHRSEFADCHIAQTATRGASIQLNTFRKTVFEGVALGDCTFLNQLMMECSYDDVELNAESIGAIFGISEKDLLSMSLVYLGQPVVSVQGAGGVLTALEADYERRRWLFMLEMLRLNFGRTASVLGLNACLDALLWPASLGAPLKAGDVAFLEMVVLELFRRKELPALNVLSFSDRIEKFRAQHAERPELQRLSNRVRELLVRMLPDLNDSIQQLRPTSQNKRVTAKLEFESKPKTDVSVLMNDLADISGFRVKGRTLLLRDAAGSYLLFMQTSLATLAALQIALWLINGCVVQIIELKARIKIASQKNLPKVVRDRVLLPDQNVPKWMAIAIQNIFSKLISNGPQLNQVAADLSSKNLRQIEIRATERRS